jgi:hypothetical protein
LTCLFEPPPHHLVGGETLKKELTARLKNGFRIRAFEADLAPKCFVMDFREVQQTKSATNRLTTQLIGCSQAFLPWANNMVMEGSYI